MKNAFLKVCFDDVVFIPYLKKIPSKVGIDVIACVSNVYDRYHKWRKITEVISEVSYKRRYEIEGMKLTKKDAKHIIQNLYNEIEGFRKSLVKAEKKLEMQPKSFKEERKNQLT